MNMMTSLFSSFDPMSGIITSLNYTPILMTLSMPIAFLLFTTMSRNSMIAQQMQKNISSELNSTISNNYKMGKLNILFMVFLFILSMNIMGLTPFIFTTTAHMMITLSMALPFWIGFIMFSVTNNTNQFFSHLVPLSTPMALSQFMTIIESVSQLIRPITLSVRLAANMTAGHILMSLTSSNINMIGSSSSVLTILLILETAVAFIQSYVFTVLLSMYLNEA